MADRPYTKLTFIVPESESEQEALARALADPDYERTDDTPYDSLDVLKVLEPGKPRTVEGYARYGEMEGLECLLRQLGIAYDKEVEGISGAPAWAIYWRDDKQPTRVEAVFSIPEGVEPLSALEVPE